MRVTLINPPITPQERYGSVVKEGAGKQAPLGICYIAAVLKQNKIPVSIIDAEAENLDYSQIIARLKKFGATAVGITSTTVAFHRALELARRIKKADKDIFVFIGGPHVSALPELTMKFDCFDVGVMGEAEYTVLELIQALSSGQAQQLDYSIIPGLICRKDGQILRSPPRPLISNLDELPYPARELLPDSELYNPPPMNYLRKPVLSVITSRGCPNQCTFCDHGVFGHKFRCHSAKRVVEEIKMLIKDYGAREISIVDDTFSVDKKRVFEFCKLLKKNHIHLPWNARISENTVTKEMLKVMKEAGCWYLEIGIETGSPRVLKDIRKGTTLEKIADIVTYADKLGFRVKGFFIIGHPTDTKESIEQTIEFAKSIPLTDIVTTIFTPFPNTPAYEQAKQHGHFIYEQDWTKFNNWEVVFLPGKLTKKQLQDYWKRMYREFYFRPSVLWRHLKQIKDLTAVKRYARGIKVVAKTLF
jgi:radical SAM superfamily enzyme YgiQ (UPF0313 family)